MQHIEHLDEQIDWMLGDIKKYLSTEEEMERNTMQNIVGISKIFRG